MASVFALGTAAQAEESSIAEAGVLMTQVAMLDRGVDVAIRDVRLGVNPGITHDDLKAKICEAAFLLGGCNEAVLLELH